MKLIDLENSSLYSQLVTVILDMLMYAYFIFDLTGYLAQYLGHTECRIDESAIKTIFCINHVINVLLVYLVML